MLVISQPLTATDSKTQLIIGYHHMNTFAVQIAAPYVSFEEYARLSGIPLATVRHLAREGRLPIRPKNKPQEKPFINMLALIKEADQQVYISR